MPVDVVGPEGTDPDRLRAGRRSYALVSGINVASLVLIPLTWFHVACSIGIVTLLIGFAMAANRIEEIACFLEEDVRARRFFGLQIMLPAAACSFALATMILGAFVNGRTEIQLLVCAAGGAALFAGVTLYSLGLITGHVSVDSFAKLLGTLGGSGFRLR